jgi:hypothetical protein
MNNVEEGRLSETGLLLCVERGQEEGFGANERHEGVQGGNLKEK